MPSIRINRPEIIALPLEFMPQVNMDSPKSSAALVGPAAPPTPPRAAALTVHTQTAASTKHAAASTAEEPFSPMKEWGTKWSLSHA